MGCLQVKSYVASVAPLCDSALFSKVYATLPAFRQDKVSTYCNEQARRLSCGAWCLLEYALHQEGLDPAYCEFAWTSAGKPYLVGSDIHFNISHSGKQVLCTLAQGVEVGCDIQEVGTYSSNLARSCMTKAELAFIEGGRAASKVQSQFQLQLQSKSQLQLQAQPQPKTQPQIQAPIFVEAKNEANKAQNFTRLWALKESYLKMLGEGLALDPLTVSVLDVPDCTLAELACDGTYCSAVCAQGKEVEIVPLQQVDLTV